MGEKWYLVHTTIHYYIYISTRPSNFRSSFRVSVFVPARDPRVNDLFICFLQYVPIILNNITAHNATPPRLEFIRNNNIILCLINGVHNLIGIILYIIEFTAGMIFFGFSKPYLFFSCELRLRHCSFTIEITLFTVLVAVNNNISFRRYRGRNCIITTNYKTAINFVFSLSLPVHFLLGSDLLFAWVYIIIPTTVIQTYAKHLT